MKHQNYLIEEGNFCDIFVTSLTNQSTKLDNFIKFHFPLNKWVKHLVASNRLHGKQIREYKERLRTNLLLPTLYCGGGIRIIKM